MHYVKVVNRIFMYCLLSLPLLWGLSLIVYYLICGMQLGRLPLPSADDPKNFGFEIAHNVILIGFILTMYTFPLSLLLTLFKKWLKLSAQQIGVFLMGTYLMVFLLAVDPKHILVWFLD